MTQCIVETELKVVAIDLAKNSFQLHGANREGNRVLSRKVGRSALKALMANLPVCQVVMEACGSAHYWARTFRRYGHEVKLIAPQFVKPFVKSNKNDAADAEAIYEASRRPTMRYVSIKEIAHQDMQSLHRIRCLAVSQRTALVNQVRGLLAEYGMVVNQGRSALMNELPRILGDESNELSAMCRALLEQVYGHIKEQDDRIADYDKRMRLLATEDEQAKRLQTIPGVGPVVATALLAAMGNGKSFRRGRELAAWLGLVPRQHSTGGKDRLLGISKRGDCYVRSLLIHGARSHLQQVGKKKDQRSRWVTQLQERRHPNIATVAMANKIARTAFALLRSKDNYRCSGELGVHNTCMS